MKIEINDEDVLHLIVDACEDIFGVGLDELEVDKTLRENGLKDSDLLPLLLKIESKFIFEIDDHYFKQEQDRNDPILFINRPVSDLVDFIRNLCLSK